FFFSSRRRHTSFSRDWSSDVCSADLFLQDARLLEQCRNPQGDQVSSGVNKLVLNRAAGQAFVWHSHTVDADPSPVPAAEAVWSRSEERRVGQESSAGSRAEQVKKRRG